MKLEEPSGPLVGLRVLDLTRGRAGAIAGMLLADYGADVLRIEPPGGDPLWDELSGYAVWHRGKDVVEIDLRQPEAQAAIRKRLPVTDVLLDGLRPGALDRVGLGWDAVADLAPRLVYATVSGFGPNESEMPGLEGLVQARLGLPAYQGARHGRPVASPYPAASYGAGLLLILGVLAALHQRERTGAGQRVDTSLVDGLLAQMTMTLVQPAGAPPATPAVSGAAPTLTIYRCGDGEFLQIHLGARGALERLCAATGLRQDDFVHQGTGRHFSGDPEGGERFRAALGATLRTRARDAWIERFQAADVPAAPCLAPGEALGHPQTRALDMTTELRDPFLGAVEVVAPPIRFQSTPGRVRGAAVQRGMPRNPEAALRHTGWLTAEEVAANEQPHLGAHHDSTPEDARPEVAGASTNIDPPAGSDTPLAGLRVLDFGMFAAGPFAAMLLAELGADVIKIEPPAGDTMRPNALPFSGLHRGKRGLGVDLKRHESADVVRRLVATADVLVHNFRPGVAERLGLGWETLSGTRPGLIHFHSSGYGTSGPMAALPGFDQIYQALCGLTVAQGGDGGPPEQVAGAPLDCLNALLTAVGILMAVVHRDRTGEGQRGECAQLSAGLFALSEFYRTPTGLTDAGRLDADRAALGPGASIERTTDGWVYVCRPDEETRERYAALADSAEVLPSRERLARLRDARVPASEVRMPFDGALLDDPLLVDHRRTVEVRDPALGPVRQPGGFLRFSAAELPEVRGGPALGEHTREILEEVGLEDETAALLAAGVVVEPGGTT